ncbi:MAG: YggU family protein [Acidobacteria bacterium]|nr:YggU family protein [Acidobacteriota bacterium]
MILKVRVIPNAKKTAFSGYREDELVLRLNAPALEGKANKAAIEFISRFFGVSRAAVSLVSGEKSRHKIFEIVGLKSVDLEEKLSGLNP